MKVTQLSLKMLLDEVKALDKAAEPLKEKSNDWLRLQKEREQYGSVDQEWVRIMRVRLEELIEEYRQQLARVYDFMGDKGLMNFEPTGEYIADEVESM